MKRTGMKRVLQALAIWAFSLFSLAAAGTQGLQFAFNGVRFNNALLGFLPVPAGADIEFAFPVSSQGLLFSLRAAGGYEDRLVLRNDSDGSHIAKPASFDPSSQKQWFHWPNLALDAGILYRPGLEVEKLTLELFGLARGRYEKNSSLLGTTIFPDASELLALSLIAGAGVSTVEKSSRRLVSGYGGEFAAEWAPKASGFLGGSDFFRVSANVEGYLPLFSFGEDDLKAISAYAGGYAVADLAWGDRIPLYVLTSFGGKYLRSGLGSSVRGYQPWGYEAASKAAASLELRLVGPGLFGMANIRPMAYVFGDAGLFSKLYASPSIDKDGLLLSTGGALALNILDFAYLGLRAGLKFPAFDPLHDAVYFTDKERFFWDIAFLLHF
ncbi:MAG: hypothetical protein RBT72_07310 [Spirochaetia bacterium]|jgi:hypothetical protein|nr:hypothetical protein [Spirochaetia bacterium]